MGREEILSELSDVRRELEPGHGRLGAGLFADEQLAGGFLDYRHRWSDGWSAFARGEAGVTYDGAVAGEVMAGVEGRW